MTEKEHIKPFDNELSQADHYHMLTPKIRSRRMGTQGGIMMSFPAANIKDTAVFFIFPFLFLGMAVIFRMQLYVYINNYVKIEPVLMYMPVDKMVFRRVRCEYLRHYLLKLGFVIFVIQQCGAFYKKSWSVWNLFYPAVVIAVLYFIGLAYIQVFSVRNITVLQGLAMLAAMIIILLGLIFLYPFSFDAEPNPNWGGYVYLYATGPLRWEGNDAVLMSMGLDITADSEEYQKMTEILDKYSYHRGIRSIFNKVIIQKKRDSHNDDGWCDVYLSLNQSLRINCDGGIWVDGKLYVVYGGEEKAIKLIGELLELMRNCPDTEIRKY